MNTQPKDSEQSQPTNVEKKKVDREDRELGERELDEVSGGISGDGGPGGVEGGGA